MTTNPQYQKSPVSMTNCLFHIVFLVFFNIIELFF